MVALRPTVSVIVPFTGTDADLQSLVDRLERLTLSPGDELIIADNRPGGPSTQLTGAVRLHGAGAVASPGFARNRGAAAAHGDWLIFIDADTDPNPDLLDAYFDPPPASGTAVLAGAIEDVADGNTATAVARHAVARAQMSQSVTLGRAEHPYAQSANIAVRRDVLVSAGGFAEHARAGEDADLCFRLADAGFRLESRPAALVRHHARSTLRLALLQMVNHGAGAGWCDDRHPGTFPPPNPGRLLRRVAHSVLVALGSWARGDRDGADFALLEIAETLAFEFGRVIPNRARSRLRP